MASTGRAAYAYVLTTNHVHLLVMPGSGLGIGDVRQALGRHYVHYHNHCHQRAGALFKGRYKATLSHGLLYQDDSRQDKYALTSW